MEQIHGCGHCSSSDLITDAEREWLDKEVGETTVSYGVLKEDFMNFKAGDFILEVHQPDIKIRTQIALSSEQYNEPDVIEIANMVGRAIQSHFVRTRLWPLLDCNCEGGMH